MTISLITNNDSNNPVEDQYKCQGVKSDETNFNSNSIPLRVFPAKTTQVPADNGHAYEDESHELVCQFPDSDVATEYTVSWEFNKQSIDMVDPDQAWHTIETERTLIADENAAIKTIFKITEVDTRANGKYSCSITWPENGVVISSGEKTLAVRLIASATEAFSMSSGFPATFSCSAVGDKVAAISFSVTDASTDMSRDVPVEVTQSRDDQERVTTVGNLDLSFLTVSSVIDCAVQWDGDVTVLKSNPNLVTVMQSVDIKSPDNSDGWVTEDRYLTIECLADVQLPNLFRVDVDFEWMLRTETSSQWVKIEDSDDFEFTISEPKYGKDGTRISSLTPGPVQIQYNAYNIKCNVDYHSNAEENFHGGKVSSEEFEIKVMHIMSFLVVSEDTIVLDEDFKLVCWAYGPPDSNAQFELINDSGNFYRHHITRYAGDKENYHEDYILTVEKVALDGGSISCTVGFEGYSYKVSKPLLVKSYYDCTKATISSFDTLLGMSIDYANIKGDIRAELVCPDDDVHGKYIIDGTDDAKEKSFCSKLTGVYEPPQLASCKFIYPFVYGTYEQVWDLQGADFTVCEYEDTNYFYSSTQIWKNLVTRSDTCGTHIVVPCLKTNECTLVEFKGKTGCSWNNNTKSLTIFYTVKLTNQVWTEKERDALVNIPLKTQIVFYDCPNDLNSGSEWQYQLFYLRGMVFDAESDTLIHEVGDMREEKKSHTGLYVGIVVAILLVIGAAIVVYYRKTIIGRLKN